MAPPSEFNPLSLDSVLSKVLQRLDEQDKAMEKKAANDTASFARIESRMDAHDEVVDNRLTEVETKVGRIRGAAAAIIAIATIASNFLPSLLGKLFSHK